MNHPLCRDILEKIDLLAAAVYQRQTELQADLPARLTAAGQEDMLRTTARTLRFLAQSIDLESPVIFSDYIDWLKVIPESLTGFDDLAVAIAEAAAPFSSRCMTSSTKVFHSPQALQRPIHFGDCVPQFWQKKAVLVFATGRRVSEFADLFQHLGGRVPFCQIDGDHLSSALTDDLVANDVAVFIILSFPKTFRH